MFCISWQVLFYWSMKGSFQSQSFKYLMQGDREIVSDSSDIVKEGLHSIVELNDDEITQIKLVVTTVKLGR